MKRDEFISELVKKRDRIIPIIGWKSFVAEQDGKEILLQKFLVDKMVPEDWHQKKEMQEKGYYGIGLLQEKKGLKNSSFKEKLENIVANSGIKLRDDVKSFLEAGKFEVVVTTVPFILLEKEFPKMYGDKEKVVSYIPLNCNGHVNSVTLKPGSLYKIFGDIQNESCVLTEKDLLRYLHELNHPDFEHGFGAAPLVKYIKERPNRLLMPIGCGDLPNWIFRFLLYPLGNPTNNDYVGGIWYKKSNDADFLQYLVDYNFITLDSRKDRNDSLFKEMAEHLTKEARDNVVSFEVEWSYSGWDYFISYASEDKEIANTIYHVLRGNGKKVWLDNRKLKAGDQYWEAIQYGIENSERCIFVITEKYLEKANTRYWDDDGHISGVYEEIKRINEYCRQSNISNYAIPLIVKNTKVKINEESKILTESLLGELHTKKAYQMLQTGELFKNRHTAIIDRENINDVLSRF